jgi:hypothetical protein
MPQRSRMTLVTAKAESTYGVDALPTAASNGQLMYARVNPVSIVSKLFEVRSLRGTFSPLPQIAVPTSQKWQGQSLLQGSGTAGVAPRLDALFRACQMSATVNAGVSVTYAPSSAFPLSGAPQSATIYTYLDGVSHQMPGTVGSFKLAGKAGEPVTVDFEMEGLYASPAAQANPAGFATDNFLATYMHGAALKLKSSLNPTFYFPTFVAFEFDAGVKVAQRSDASSSAGVKGFMPVARSPKLKLTLEADFANRNFFPELEQGVLLEAYFSQGSAAGNTISFSFPTAQLTDVRYGDAGGVRTVELAFALVTSTSGADSEFSLAFA